MRSMIRPARTKRVEALERERSRLIAARDAAILAKRTAADDDFDELAAHASTFGLDID